MDTKLQVIETSANIALFQRGQAANDAAQRQTFASYTTRKAESTVRRHASELASFADFLNIEADLHVNAASWAGISWGLVDGYIKGMLIDGFAIGTANIHLSTIKTYSKLAFRAGTMPMSEYAAIQALSPYGHNEGANFDARRVAAGIETRVGNKKQTANTLTPAQCEALRAHVAALDGDQGKRDAALLMLLLDLGIRVSEAAGLRVADYDAEAARLTVCRQKTKTETRFILHNGKLSALTGYLDAVKPSEQLLLGSRKGGALVSSWGMSTRAINARVAAWGQAIGIDNLSPHDLRHTAATAAARDGWNISRLMEFFGWASPATAARYIEAAEEIEVL